MRAQEDYQVISAMALYGGSFVQALAALCDRADAENLDRIKAAFPEIWAEYVEIARSRRVSGDMA